MDSFKKDSCDFYNIPDKNCHSQQEFKKCEINIFYAAKKSGNVLLR